MKADLHETLK